MQEKSNESEKKKAIIKNFKRIGVKDGMSLDFFQIELTKPIKPANGEAESESCHPRYERRQSTRDGRRIQRRILQ